MPQYGSAPLYDNLPARPPAAAKTDGIDLKFIFNVCFMVVGGCFAVYALPHTGAAVMLDAFSIRLVLLAAVASALGGFLCLSMIIYMTTFPKPRNIRDATFCFGGLFISACVLVAVGSMLIFAGRIAWTK